MATRLGFWLRDAAWGEEDAFGSLALGLGPFKHFGPITLSDEMGSVRACLECGIFFPFLRFSYEIELILVKNFCVIPVKFLRSKQALDWAGLSYAKQAEQLH